MSAAASAPIVSADASPSLLSRLKRKGALDAEGISYSLRLALSGYTRSPPLSMRPLLRFRQGRRERVYETNIDPEAGMRGGTAREPAEADFRASPRPNARSPSRSRSQRKRKLSSRQHHAVHTPPDSLLWTPSSGSETKVCTRSHLRGAQSGRRCHARAERDREKRARGHADAQRAPTPSYIRMRVAIEKPPRPNLARVIFAAATHMHARAPRPDGSQCRSPEWAPQSQPRPGRCGARGAPPVRAMRRKLVTYKRVNKTPRESRRLFQGTVFHKFLVSQMATNAARPKLFT
ncbi:hypothetical protein DENSPDRAFT_873475 [Dentipellis sp. KUC8613]|nr:hypothetical protein DENSPDRAFT_873475 [Dentipellis sp. KUC8613]